MHRELAEPYGGPWYDNSDAGLDRGAGERIASARMELTRDGRGDGSSRIVTVCRSVGVSLLGPRGDLPAGRKANHVMMHWRPVLRGAFAHRAKLTSKQVHRALNDLRTLYR